MGSKFVSIVVPVYNTQKYLSKCIGSILLQNHKDFELILINDGSTDDSGQICEDYMSKDSRIKVFHKENGGVSSARNLGINNASGDWICFIDSDDYVDDNFLEVFFQENILPKDIIIQGATKISENGNILDNSRQYPNIKINHNHPEAIIKYDLFRNINEPYCKLFNKKIINQNNIEFPIGVSLGEDLLFVLNYLSYVENIILLPSVSYYIVSREGSLTKRAHPYPERLKRSVLSEPIVKKVITHFKLGDTRYGKCLLSSMVLEPRFNGIGYLYYLEYNRKERINAIKKLLDCDKEYFRYYIASSKKRKLQNHFLRFFPASIYDLVNLCYFSLVRKKKK